MPEQQRGKVVTKFGIHQQPSSSGSFAHLDLGSLTVSSLTAYNQVIKNTTTVSELQTVQSVSANSISSVSISGTSLTSDSISAAGITGDTISAGTLSLSTLTIDLSGILVGRSSSATVSAIPFTTTIDYLRGDGVFVPFIHNSLSAKQGLGPDFYHLNQVEYDGVASISSLSAGLINLSASVTSLSSTVTSHTVQINALSSTVTSHTVEINALSSTVTGQTVQINSLSSSVTSLSSTVTAHTVQINSLSSSVTSLSASLSSLSATVTSNQKNMMPITGTTANLDMNNFHIINLATPTANADAVTKLYDDQKFIDINRDGFLNQTETVYSFDGTNTFTISATTGTTWSYYRAGLKWTITGSKSIVLPGSPISAGIHYIFINSNDGSLSSTFNSAWSLTDSKVPVVTILFNNTLSPKYWIADERHTCLIDNRIHYYLHTSQGSKTISAGALSGYTLNSDVDANKTFSIGATIMLDEDIIHAEPAFPQPNGTTSSYPVFYRVNATDWNWKLSNMPFVYNVGNTHSTIQFDNAGTMTDATTGNGVNTRWVNSYLLVTNFDNDSTSAGASGAYVVIMGQAQFTTLALAQAEIPTTFSFGNFPINESTIFYRLTWTTVTSTSSGRCRLAATPQSINVVTVSNAGSGASIDHNTLANLHGISPYNHLSDAELAIVDSISGALTSDVATLSSSITGLQSITGNFVPYQGATANVNLGIYSLSALSITSNYIINNGTYSQMSTSWDASIKIGQSSSSYLEMFQGYGTFYPILRTESGTFLGIEADQLDFYTGDTIGSRTSRLSIGLTGDITIGPLIVPTFKTYFTGTLFTMTDGINNYQFTTEADDVFYLYKQSGDIRLLSFDANYDATFANAILCNGVTLNSNTISGYNGYIQFSGNIQSLSAISGVRVYASTTANPLNNNELTTKFYVDTLTAAAAHSPLSLGTANGLTLNVTAQQLSLTLASSTTTGSITNTDWLTFQSITSLSATVNSLTGSILPTPNRVIFVDSTLTGNIFPGYSNWNLAKSYALSLSSDATHPVWIRRYSNADGTVFSLSADTVESLHEIGIIVLDGMNEIFTSISAGSITANNFGPFAVSSMTANSLSAFSLTCDNISSTSVAAAISGSISAAVQPYYDTYFCSTAYVVSSKPYYAAADLQTCVNDAYTDGKHRIRVQSDIYLSSVLILKDGVNIDAKEYMLKCGLKDNAVAVTTHVEAKKIIGVGNGGHGVTTTSSGSDVTIVADYIQGSTAGVGSNVGVASVSGSLKIWAKTISGGRSSSIGMWNLGGSLTVYEGNCYAGGSAATCSFIHQNGITYYKSGAIFAEYATVSSNAVILTASGVCFGNVVLFNNSTSGCSISSASAFDVYSYGTLIANTDKSSNITIKGGTLIVDSSIIRPIFLR